MVSFSSIPFTELIIIALVYMAWGANKMAKYFESYVVLYFLQMHTRGKTAVETAKKVVDRIAVTVTEYLKDIEYYNLND